MNLGNPSTPDLGATLRDLRKAKGVTLGHLAEGIGRSVGFLSQIERGLSRPTVEDLTLIQQRLGVPSGYLFPSPGAQTLTSDDVVSRAGQRRQLRYERGVTDHLLSPRLSEDLCLLETVLDAGADTGEAALVDRRQQAGYLLQGQLLLTSGERRWTLAVGDAFHLAGGQPCHLHNPGPGSARLLWVLTH